jgi:hypothetical protein
MLASSAVDRGFISGVMVSILASSAVDRGFICGVMVSMLASSAVDRGFISGVMVSMLASSAVDRGFICGVMVSMLASSAVDHGFISGVMVSMLASSAVDRGFESRSSQTKDYEIDICCFSTNHAALRRKSKDWLAQNQANVSSGTTCLSVDCCFSELALQKFSTKRTLPSSLKINMFSP